MLWTEWILRLLPPEYKNKNHFKIISLCKSLKEKKKCFHIEVEWVELLRETYPEKSLWKFFFKACTYWILLGVSQICLTSVFSYSLVFTSLQTYLCKQRNSFTNMDQFTFHSISKPVRLGGGDQSILIEPDSTVPVGRLNKPLLDSLPPFYLSSPRFPTFQPHSIFFLSFWRSIFLFLWGIFSTLLLKKVSVIYTFFL